MTGLGAPGWRLTSVTLGDMQTASAYAAQYRGGALALFKRHNNLLSREQGAWSVQSLG
jgi:hypothetical protein